MKQNIAVACGAVLLLAGLIATSVSAMEVDCDASAGGRSGFSTGQTVGRRLATIAWEGVGMDCGRLNEFLASLDLPFDSEPVGVRAQCLQQGTAAGVSEVINEVTPMCTDACLEESQTLGETFADFFCNGGITPKNVFSVCDAAAAVQCESTFRQEVEAR